MEILVEGCAERQVRPELGELRLGLGHEGDDREFVVDLTSDLARRFSEAVAPLHPQAVVSWGLEPVRVCTWRSQRRGALRYRASAEATVVFRDFQALADFAVGWGAAPGVEVRHTSWKLAPETEQKLEDELLTEAVRAARRLGPQVTGMRVYGLPQAPMAASVWEFSLPHGRLTFTLTAEHYRGFSGEGALLTKLAAPTAVDDSALISACLAFEPRIEIASLVAETGLDEERTGQGLAVLAGDGRVGFDLYEQAYFHRELPSDADRVIKDNPRLRHAKRLVTAGAVRPFDGHPGTFRVRGDHDEYIVRTGPPSCTCPWWRGHAGSRGVCKHILAVELSRAPTEHC